jgi:hypothetical protein
MGEAKRSANTGTAGAARGKGKEWKEYVNHVQTVFDEGAGVWVNHIVHQREVPRLLRAAAAGDRQVTAIMRSVVHMVAQVSEASRTTKPVLCLCCPREIHVYDGFSVCLTMAHRDDSTRALGSAICSECISVDEVTFKAKILTAMQKIIPDAKVIEPQLEPGHA